MKIVAFSDTHTFHEQVSVPNGDVLVFAGDATISGTSGELAKFLSWLSDLPHKIKLITPGNHDFYFERKERIAREMVAAAGKNIKLLINETFLYEGLSFYGSPITPWFMDWAYNVQPELIKKYWDRIPIDTDVLITHGPKYGIGDQAYPTQSAWGESSDHLGCIELKSAVERIQPRLHIFGHIHGGYGVYKREGSQTKSINASICTEAYKPTNKPIEVEID